MYGGLARFFSKPNKAGQWSNSKKTTIDWKPTPTASPTPFLTAPRPHRLYRTIHLGLACHDAIHVPEKQRLDSIARIRPLLDDHILIIIILIIPQLPAAFHRPTDPGPRLAKKYASVASPDVPARWRLDDT